jgi:hypothetical protein
MSDPKNNAGVLLDLLAAVCAVLLIGIFGTLAALVAASH